MIELFPPCVRRVGALCTDPTADPDTFDCTDCPCWGEDDGPPDPLHEGSSIHNHSRGHLSVPASWPRFARPNRLDCVMLLDFDYHDHAI